MRTVSRVRPDVLISSANYALLRCPVPQVLLIREGGLFDPFYLANIAPEQGMEAAVLRSLRRRLMIRSGRRADRVFTPSETTRDHLLMWAPDLRPKLTANHYGAPIVRFAPPAGAAARDLEGPPRLLYVSVYYPHKAPYVLVRAVERLNREGLAARATISMTEGEIAGRAGGALGFRALLAVADHDEIRPAQPPTVEPAKRINQDQRVLAPLQLSSEQDDGSAGFEFDFGAKLLARHCRGRRPAAEEFVVDRVRHREQSLGIDAVGEVVGPVGGADGEKRRAAREHPVEIGALGEAAETAAVGLGGERVLGSHQHRHAAPRSTRHP